MHRVASDMYEAGYFALQVDKVTDSSNQEQVVVCIWWVEAQHQAHEDFIGFHHVAEITFETIVSVLKDTVLRLNLILSLCRGKCYDGASNMKK